MLVSAAAGSGKTAVLVERILALITDPEAGYDIDRLLVVTFTDAAAAEMKDRILRELEKRSEADPRNENLARQISLIHNANISTIHSFCRSVLKEHFQEIDLDPSFRTVDEGEGKLLRQEIIDGLLEECYLGETENFLPEEDNYLKCAEALETGRLDTRIGENVLKLYEEAQSYADPEAWLMECRKRSEYNALSSEEWMIRLLDRIRLEIGNASETLEFLAGLCEGEGPDKYLEPLRNEAGRLEEISRSGITDYAAFKEALENMEWTSRMPTISRKDYEAGVSEPMKIYIVERRKAVIADFKAIQNDYFYAPPDEILNDLKNSGEIQRVLIDLTLEFGKRFDAEKRRRNLIDFSDMEHLALRVLSSKEDGKLVPSRAAKEYQEYFQEVMIDEYQDSNYLQETLLSLVSSHKPGTRDRFMVGDVKQSIYSFRQSRPELFIEKYKTYSDGAGTGKRRVSLSRNFRSREEVIDSVNVIFRKLMVSEVGGIDYDKDQELIQGASFPEEGENPRQEQDPYKSEALLAELTDENSTERKWETESKMIAERILALKEEKLSVLDKDTGNLRPVEYRDIVVLLRSAKDKADIVNAVLTDYGIPAYTRSRTGYFSAKEVQTILNYLRVLDNPLQDIPMAAALRSPIGGFTSGELAEIRSAFPEISFAEAVLKFGATTEEETKKELIEKLNAFLSQAEDFRKRITYTPLHQLIWEILEETGYGVYLMAMPEGARRKANIDFLIEKAISFEKTSYKGVFHFLRYLDQIQSQEIDFGEANVTAENADVVRIMTIHKSKGLEFPVVFAAGMGEKLSKIPPPMMEVHHQYGIAIDSIDTEKRIRAATIHKKMISRETKVDLYGEEIRALYVAFTRAKEKLFITGTVKDADRAMDRWILEGDTRKNGSFSDIMKASEYLDLLMPVLLKNNREFATRVVTSDQIIGESVIRRTGGKIDRKAFESVDISRVYDQKLEERLERAKSYQYPFANAARQAAKLSVSEIKRKNMEEELEQARQTIPEEEPIPLIPRFLADNEPSGAFRGTAYHKFLELFDFRLPEAENRPIRESVEETLRELEKSGHLTAETRKAVNIRDIETLLASDLGKRLAAARARGTLCRERPFVLGVKESEIYPESAGDDTYLVQGIIDAFFEEDGALTLLDYKTDRVSAAGELILRYQSQLDWYAKALEQLTGKKVKEKIIYSFWLKLEIHLEEGK